MVKVIHCPECYKMSEIRSDDEIDLYDEPTYCPFCGTNNGLDHEDERPTEDYDEYH